MLCQERFTETKAVLDTSCSLINHKSAAGQGNSRGNVDGFLICCSIAVLSAFVAFKVVRWIVLIKLWKNFIYGSHCGTYSCSACSILLCNAEWIEQSWLWMALLLSICGIQEQPFQQRCTHAKHVTVMLIMSLTPACICRYISQAVRPWSPPSLTCTLLPRALKLQTASLISTALVLVRPRGIFI